MRPIAVMILCPVPLQQASRFFGFSPTRLTCVYRNVIRIDWLAQHSFVEFMTPQRRTAREATVTETGAFHLRYR
jgi:hypothetical protein